MKPLIKNPKHHYCSKCKKRIYAIHPDGRGPCCFNFKKYAMQKLPCVVNPEYEEKAKANKRAAATIIRNRFKAMGLTTKGEPRKIGGLPTIDKIALMSCGMLAKDVMETSPILAQMPMVEVVA
jgi:hypothetical protein